MLTFDCSLKKLIVLFYVHFLILFLSASLIFAIIPAFLNPLMNSDEFKTAVWPLLIPLITAQVVWLWACVR